MSMASVIPTKATTGDFAANRVVAFMKEVGCEQGNVVVKGDQEPALGASRDGGWMIVERSPVGSSNGVIERPIQSLVKQARVMRSALEANSRVKIPGSHAIWTWTFAYCTHLLNRLEVAKGGKVAYERNKWKKAKVQGMEFG